MPITYYFLVNIINYNIIVFRVIYNIILNLKRMSCLHNKSIYSSKKPYICMFSVLVNHVVS